MSQRGLEGFGEDLPLIASIAGNVFLLVLVGCASVERIEEGPVDLWLGGDVHLGDGGRGVLRALSPLTAGAVGVVNLEGPAASAAVAGPGIRLYNAREALSELSSIGVRLAGIANNHAGDAG